MQCVKSFKGVFKEARHFSAAVTVLRPEVPGGISAARTSDFVRVCVLPPQWIQESGGGLRGLDVLFAESPLTVHPNAKLS